MSHYPNADHAPSFSILGGAFIFCQKFNVLYNCSKYKLYTLGGHFLKTFKLISVQVLLQDKIIPINLVDGLIINKEDEKSKWLLEVYTTHEYIDFFQKRKQQQEKLLVHAVITKKENDPAPFEVEILSTQLFNQTASILLEGNLKRDRIDYAELLLDYLLKEGFAGEELSAKFKELMQSKPQAFLEKN